MTPGISRDEWWAYVFEREIMPTLRSYCRAPLILTPITPIQPPRPGVGGALEARSDPGRPPRQAE